MTIGVLSLIVGLMRLIEKTPQPPQEGAEQGTLHYYGTWESFMQSPLYVGRTEGRRNVRTMMHRCDNCNSVLELCSPQRGEQDAIMRCGRCGRFIVLDAQPSAPQSLPAKPVVYVSPHWPVTEVWLN